MKNKLKLITVVGTRPELIRLSRVLSALDNCVSIEHITVHTGQNFDYELNQIFYDDLDIRKPDYFLNCGGTKTINTISEILIRIDSLIEELLPDAFLVLGDTNSCLSAIAAKKRKIPIFHMEAGNRCFDQRVPEEVNRKIVDHIADINLCYSDISREYLLREGILPDRVIKTGSPMFEVLDFYKEKIRNSIVLEKINLEKGKYIVISAHRDENISSDINFEKFINLLQKLIEIYNYPIVISTHPKTRKKIQEVINKNINYFSGSVSKIIEHPLLKWQVPLSFSDYISLQCNSLLVLSDSGTISEESSILNFKALNIREAHERPEAIEEGAVMMVGLDYNRVLHGIDHLLSSSSNNVKIVSDYNVNNVSEKVVRIIISYVDYINKNVWKK